MTDEQLEQLADLVALRVAKHATPRLVDADAIAAQLDVPKSWVLAEARANRIPHTRLGKYVRFQPDLIAEWATKETTV